MQSVPRRKATKIYQVNVANESHAYLVLFSVSGPVEAERLVVTLSSSDSATMVVRYRFHQSAVEEKSSGLSFIPENRAELQMHERLWNIAKGDRTGVRLTFRLYVPGGGSIRVIPQEIHYDDE